LTVCKLGISGLLVFKGCLYYYSQRAGIADGGEFYIRPPGTTAEWNYFDEVKIK